MTQPKLIAYVFEYQGVNKHRANYVCSLPQNGSDYGYTYNEAQAFPLSDSEWRAFAGYIADLNQPLQTAFCIPCDQ